MDCSSFFIIELPVESVIFRGGKKEKGSAKTSKGSKAMLELKINKTLPVCRLFQISFLKFSLCLGFCFVNLSFCSA